MQYKYIVRLIISRAYDLTGKSALTVSELLSATGDEAAMEQVLVDDDTTRLRRLDQLTRALRTELAYYEVRRMRPPLAESTIAPGSFTYSFADDLELEEEIRDLNGRLRMLPQLLSYMHELSPTQFEQLCGLVMIAVGAHHVTVTKSQKDDGVDVIAELPVDAGLDIRPTQTLSPFYRILGSLSFLIYCQAKQYAEDNPVGAEEVQRLEGSWQSVRNAYFEGTLAPDRAKAFAAADYRLADPVLLIMMTTSSYTRGAFEKGKLLGMVLLDGEQLAQLLLEHGFGVIRVHVANYETSLDILVAHLETSSNLACVALSCDACTGRRIRPGFR
jgi:restriction endonuclease Mrr